MASLTSRVVVLLTFQPCHNDPPPTMDEVKGYLAEVIEMIASGTCEDQKAVTSVLVGPTIVKGRHSIRPSFILPTQKVRVLPRVVHPDLQNANCGAIVDGDPVELTLGGR
ncbi:MAG TPA: hypothetical protein VJX71_13175 [Methylomirabilota bacterium]|nr:hypothetical protein [Methylomirabilota bacterium]